MRRSLSILILVALCLPAMAWKWWPLPMDQGDHGRDSIEYEVGIRTLSSSGTYAPFWIHANQHGAVSIAPHSSSLRAMVEKRATRPGRWWDYDFAIDVVGSLTSNLPGLPAARELRRFPYIQGKNAALSIQRLSGHFRLYIFDLTVGVNPIAPCNPEADPELTTGDLLFSTHAPAMPHISVGIDRYTAVPGLFGYLEVRTGLTHAWMNDNIFVRKSFIHYKYGGARIGGKLPVNIGCEIHHAAQWGGYSPVEGDLGNNWRAFRNAFTGKEGGSMFNDQLNAQGNHLITMMWNLIAKGDGWRVSATWQNLIEDDFRFIGMGRALSDGLWALRAHQSRWPYISGFSLEYLGTTDQSGPLHDQDGYTLNGNDNYYRNGIYRNGWNYNYHTLGTPFITSPLYNREGQIHTLNNRTKTWYLGLKGDIYGYRYRVQGSHSRNYYTYSDGGDTYAEMHRNLAWMVEVQKTVPQAWGLDFGVRVAGDIGNQFGNTVGVMVSVAKRGLITSY